MREKSSKGMVGIYLIRHIPSDTKFVGSSASINNQWMQLIQKLYSSEWVNSRLQELWLQDGPTAFEFSILELLDDRYALLERQLYWMQSENAADMKGRLEEEMRKDLGVPSGFVSVYTSTKSVIKDMKKGTMVNTVKMLVDFYKQHHS